MRRTTTLFALVAIFHSVTASFAAITDEDRAAIQGTIESYVKAFNDGDLDTILNLWDEHGDYIDVSGRHLKGKDQIRAAYEEFLANAPDPRVEIAITSLDSYDDNIVIEDGFRDVSTSPTMPGRRIRYTAFHHKHDGKWCLLSVRDAAAFTPTNYEYLRGLEWAIGNWESKAENGAVMRSGCTLDESQNYLIREYSTSLQGQEVSSGFQWIGWDPARSAVRSWSFDSTGGFGEATWSQEENAWIADSTSTLRTGQQLLETQILERVDQNTLKWTVKNRTLDGKPVPDVEAVTVNRVKP